MYRFLEFPELPGTDVRIRFQNLESKVVGDGIFHESQVFNFFPVIGWMTALAWCRCD
jgi:hypothetical protein